MCHGENRENHGKNRARTRPRLKTAKKSRLSDDKREEDAVLRTYAMVKLRKAMMATDAALEANRCLAGPVNLGFCLFCLSTFDLILEHDK